MDELPTVRVASDHPEHGGFIVINKTDFREGEHELFVESGEQTKPRPRGRPRKVTEDVDGADEPAVS